MNPIEKDIEKEKKKYQNARMKLLERLLDDYAQDFFGYPPDVAEEGILIGGAPPRLDRLEKLFSTMGVM